MTLLATKSFVRGISPLPGGDIPPIKIFLSLTHRLPLLEVSIKYYYLRNYRPGVRLRRLLDLVQQLPYVSLRAENHDMAIRREEVECETETS